MSAYEQQRLPHTCDYNNSWNLSQNCDYGDDLHQLQYDQSSYYNNVTRKTTKVFTKSSASSTLTFTSTPTSTSRTSSRVGQLFSYATNQLPSSLSQHIVGNGKIHSVSVKASVFSRFNRMMSFIKMLPRAAGARRTLFLLGFLFTMMGLLLYMLGYICTENNFYNTGMITNEKYVIGADKKVYMYNRQMPLIFIGGVPRSGTTLMRAMLDAHPEVRCGQETRVIPRLLQMRSHWVKSEKESIRLKEAGITKEVLDSAIAAFCLEIIARHGEPAPRLCNKDPLTIKMGTYVVDLFPNAKFIFMVRDGRATVHSIISRKVTITGFDLTNYRQCLTKWNQAVELMNNQCNALGKDRCMRVKYEQLVLHPRKWMTRILEFLDIPWNESVLHHEEFINKPNGIVLSKVERSSDQVIKPINLEALTKWVGNIPEDVVNSMADIAPMLSVLGYDPYANPPKYGDPDSEVAHNTRQIKRNSHIWQEKARQLFKVDKFDENLIDELTSSPSRLDADRDNGG